MRTITLLALSLALLLAPLGTVAAQSDDERDYDVNVSDEKATVTVERSPEDRTATVEMAFDTRSSTFATSFDYENATSHKAAHLEAQLHQLVEYVDEDGDGAFDDGEEIASSWQLSEDARNVTGAPSNGTVEWDALNSTEVTGPNGTPGTKITGEAQFASEDPIEAVGELLGQAENRTVRVQMWIFDEAVTKNGTQISPTEVKVDLIVDNYPYQREDTRLALLVEGTSETPLAEPTSGDTGLAVQQEIENLDVDLHYAWSDRAKVDGEPQPVQTSSYDPENGTASDTSTQRVLAVSYDRGDTIRHDVTLGAEIAQAGFLGDRIGDTTDEVPGFGVWTALAAITGTVALARLRQR